MPDDIPFPDPLNSTAFSPAVKEGLIIINGQSGSGLPRAPTCHG